MSSTENVRMTRPGSLARSATSRLSITTPAGTSPSAAAYQARRRAGAALPTSTTPRDDPAGDLDHPRAVKSLSERTDPELGVARRTDLEPDKDVEWHSKLVGNRCRPGHTAARQCENDRIGQVQADDALGQQPTRRFAIA